MIMLTDKHFWEITTFGGSSLVHHRYMPEHSRGGWCLGVSPGSKIGVLYIGWSQLEVGEDYG